ncbi:N-lysine methyltransferase KMT5A-A [Thunnus maccoyii]|uniref:N-lysine methyltransferase KMT5A-A n=1 Tax=Thunnus maccoyii TaxID=8240 RepID=UPI001C4AE8F6|nr:N-lysine methyltransferase KMT5A-A [Thunnus maccoyii]
MNGEIVCNSHSVTVLSCTKSISPVHDEQTIKLTQEDRCSPVFSQLNDAQRQGEGRRINTISATTKDSEFTEMESSFIQCSPCWSDEQPSPPQLHRSQTFLRSPAELPQPLGNSLSHTSYQTNNRRAPHGQQRSRVRNRVKDKKSTPRLYARPHYCLGKTLQNQKVTDFFPIRRSSRKSKTEIKCEQKKAIDDLITNGIEEGMEVQYIEGKGRAVFATRCFQKGEYVVEYHGDLLQITDAKKREAEYAQNPATGCYMYYFQYLCKTYCVDATKETDRMGRLINHSKNGNCQTKLHDINGVPHLILVASRDIDEGEELLYDYGDRSKASIAAHPWLKH